MVEESLKSVFDGTKIMNSWIYVLLGVFTFFVFLQALYGVNLVYLSILSRVRGRRLGLKKVGKYEYVTVQLPVFNEADVVSRLISAACALEWPLEKLEIQVLDDSTDETSTIVANIVQKYQKTGVKIMHIRRKNREGFKAGALDEGLKKTKGEFIAIFDADFIPAADFLKKTMGHFDDDVAMVQARWSYVNRRKSLLTRVQAIVLDAHFSCDQQARFSRGLFFNFNGTAGVWRKAAIDDAGGWKHDTLTEDLDLTYRAQLRGWRCVYLDKVDARSEIPESVSALRLQQQRWAKGHVQCAGKLIGPILKSQIGVWRKVQALYHITTYWMQAVAFIVLLFFPVVLYLSYTYLGITINAPTYLLLGTFFAPGFHYMSAQRNLGEWKKRWKHVLLTGFVAPGLLVNTIYAFMSLVLKKVHIFERTPKQGGKKKSKYFLGISPVFKWEILFWFYITGTIVYALLTRNWLYVLYSSIFFTGTSAMIVYTLKEVFDAARA